MRKWAAGFSRKQFSIFSAISLTILFFGVFQNCGKQSEHSASSSSDLPQSKVSSSGASSSSGAVTNANVSNSSSSNSVNSTTVYLPLPTISIVGALDSQQAIRQILSRAITMQGMADDLSQYPQAQIDEDIKMLDEIRPTMIGRWAGWWGSSWDGPSDNDHFQRATNIANRIHATNSETVLEAAVFEYLNPNVSNFPVPAWAFTEMGMPVQTRNFNFEAMKFDDFATNPAHRWDGSGAVPDVTKSEARLWLYYRARRYIDAGAEAIHLGQIMLMSDQDILYSNLWGLVSKIRDYGRVHARRQRVLINGHTGGRNIYFLTNRNILDFYESPLTQKEIGPGLSNVILEDNFRTAPFKIYAGGLTPGGETVGSTQYLAEFDNYGMSNHPGQLASPPASDWYVFGYDEITWFSKLTETDRNTWLQYASDWLKADDPNGHLEMPGRRNTSPPDVTWPTVIQYRANRGYFNQVPKIKCIWGGNCLALYSGNSQVPSVLGPTVVPPVTNVIQPTFGH